MLYHLIQIRGGKETIFMTDQLPRVRNRRKQLRDSHRDRNWQFVIRPAKEDAVKYRRPPNMNFDPSGDADQRKYRARKAKARKIRKENKRHE